MARATTTKKTTKKSTSSSLLTARHTGHQNHMCELVRRREMARAAKLAKGAKYLCRICGRAAAKGANLCEAVEI